MRSKLLLIPMVGALALVWGAAVAVEARVAAHTVVNTMPPQPTEASPRPRVELLNWLGGEVRAVASTGDRTYVGVGARMVVFDTSDASQPRQVGSSPLLGGTVKEVAVLSGTAYVATAGRMYTVDVGDPANPKLLGSLAVVGQPLKLVVSGTLAFLAAGERGLQVMDVSNPLSPTTRVVLYGDGRYVHGVALANEPSGRPLLYMADWLGLHVMDITSPTSPIELGRFQTWCAGGGVAVADGAGGKRLAIIVYRNPMNPHNAFQLLMLDVSDPVSPTLLGGQGAVRDVTDMVMAPDATGRLLAYVTTARTGADIPGTGGLQIIDLGDPSAPVQVGMRYVEGACAVALSTDSMGRRIAWVAVGAGGPMWGARGFQAFDVSTPANPSLVAIYEPPHDVQQVTLRADASGRLIAYLAAGSTGLRTVDVSDPQQPIEVGALTGLHAQDVAVAEHPSGCLIACVVHGDLSIVDVTDPANPTRLASLDMGGKAKSVAISGTVAYVGADDMGPPHQSGGLRMVDISEPLTPTERTPCFAPGYGLDVALWGTLAYVADGVYGLRVIDVSDDNNPWQVGQMGGVDARGVIAARDLVGRPTAYVAGQGLGLGVVDISWPTSPTLLATSAAGDSSAVALSTDPSGRLLAYVAEYQGVRIVDVSNPPYLSEVDYYVTPGVVAGLAVHGDVVYVGVEGAGLLILRHNGDTSRMTFPLVLR